MSTGAGRLLAEVEVLSHHERQQRLALLGNRLAGTADLDQLLAALSGLGAYQRQLALGVATAARHQGFVQWCLWQDEPALSHRAWSIALRHRWIGADLLPKVVELPRSLRNLIYRKLRQEVATDLAELLLPLVRSRHGDREAATLLPTCSAPMVGRLLPDLAYAVSSWRAIGQRHPEVLLTFLRLQIAALPRGVWPSFGARFAPGVAAAAVERPDRAFDLLEVGLFDGSLPPTIANALPLLARRDPSRLLRILLSQRRRWEIPAGRPLWRAMEALDDGGLQEFARLVAAGGSFQQFLRQVPVARRTRIYRSVVGVQDLAQAHLSIDVLDLLPAADRVAEAERLLASRSGSEQPVLRRQLRSRLPFGYVQAELFERTAAPEAADRADGYRLLLSAAAATRDPAVVLDVLRSLTRLRRDQDPVRLAAMTTLAHLPAWSFPDAAVGELSTIVGDALAAPDCSSATRRTLQGLIQRLLVEGAARQRPALLQFALAEIETISRYQQDLRFPGLRRNLPSDSEFGILAVLLPRLEADRRRDDFGVTLALAEGLADRAWTLEPLQRLLFAACASQNDAVVTRAIRLYLADPRTRDVRVEQVWRGDPSTVTIGVVAGAISRRRTDLLTSVLSASLAGRFVKPEIRLIPTFTSGFSRWTAGQRRDYAGMVDELAKSETQPLHTRAAAVRRLGRIPGADAWVRPYLARAELTLQEAAISALPGVENPGAALLELLALGDTDLARVALPAVARVARQVRPDQFGVAVLPALSGAKITLRKAAVQLVVREHVPAGSTALIQAWDRPGQHRDVRRAVVCGLSGRLDDPGVWRVLGEAATDPAIASTLPQIRLEDIADRHRAAIGGLITVVAASADRQAAVLAFHALPAWSRWAPEILTTLAEVVLDLDRPADWSAAAESLVRACALTDAGTELIRVVSVLQRPATVTGGATATARTAPDRDEPARQRLNTLGANVISQVRQDPSMTGLARRCADELTDPTLEMLAGRLRVAAIDWETLHLASELHRVTDPITRPAVLAALLPALRTDLARIIRRGAMVDGAVAVLLADGIGDPHDEGGSAPAHLALALCSVAAGQRGWTPERRAVLDRLRRHSDVDVRSAALDVVAVPE
ncbi:hypothetical protein ABIB25_002757 [Nakamurella sp. UYEF19]|uniref:hypothetical protein n=1 Tax=Nakamurella sp. UYEF19 TaxID=1756392 RepID=UPI0033954BE8